MKVAVSCLGRDMESPVDPRFGRAAGFLVCDTEGGEASYLANDRNADLAQGAGIQTAQDVAGTGARVLITGHVGPKAFTALSRGGIRVHLLPAGSQECTVRQALELLRKGDLPPAEAPDRAGHH